MTHAWDRALVRAARLARRRSEFMYVVRGDHTVDEQFAVLTGPELDAAIPAREVLESFGPDGERAGGWNDEDLEEDNLLGAPVCGDGWGKWRDS